MNTPIHKFLQSYAAKNPVRCHMPGGKLNPFDITEIEGADSLFESSGIIKESENNTASLFGAAKTLFSCGGSTLAIQTMLALAKAIAPQKTQVIASRYCHKSLLTSCILLGLEIDFIFPEEYLSCKITPKSVEEKISENTLCVFLQSIDYYGGQSDIAEIAEICKRKKILLLTDNAHGAYTVFTGTHPLSLGADMIADSAHKTLPCLTGGAYLHISKSAAPALLEKSKETMSLFGSSSPSYLILDSLDMCNIHIAEQKERAEKVFEEIKILKRKLRLLGYTLKQSDMMRVTIDACEYGYSGFALAEKFAESDIVSEFSDNRYLVLLFSTGQAFSDFKRIICAAEKIKPLPQIAPKAPPIVTPKREMNLREAFFAVTEKIAVEKAEGRICADISTPCPPCVPIVMPGERLGKEEIGALKAYGVEWIRVIGQ